MFFSSVSHSSAASVYDFTVENIDGQEIPLVDYKGKVLVIVNTASKCGFTSQYRSLQKLYDQYQAQGLEILAFPANNFMNQEPGTDEEIKEFCLLNFNTSFPLFSKISVKGKDMHPLYRYLTKDSPFPGGISWNFNKFIVNRQGEVIKRFGSRIDPIKDDFVETITTALAEE